MKKINKILIPITSVATLSIAISPITGCKSQTVMPTIKDKEVWFNACDKIDTSTLKNNFSILQEHCEEDGLRVESYTRIVKDKRESFTDKDIRHFWEQYNSKLNIWFNFSFAFPGWYISREDSTHLARIVDLLKNYFVNHQDRFQWFTKSNNSVSIELLDESILENYRNIDIEFFEDTKLFKSIYLWSPSYDPPHKVGVGEKYTFYNYDASRIEPQDDFNEQYYNNPSIDTTKETKIIMYDTVINHASTQSPTNLKFYLTSSAGQNIPMLNDGDDKIMRCLKPDGTIAEIWRSEIHWDQKQNILVVDNSRKVISVGDRVFFSVFFPSGIVANNIQLKWEEITD